MSNDRRDRRYLSDDDKRPGSVGESASETVETTGVTTATDVSAGTESKTTAGSTTTESTAATAGDCGCGRDHRGVTRRTVLGGAAAAVTASAFSLPAAAQEDDTFTIVHDLHSHSDIGEPGGPNIARYQTVLQEQLGDRDDVLFMGSGDELGSSLVSFFTEGEHKVEFMNDMGLSLVGVGNHDFDYGIDSALEQFEQSEFPWVTSNLKTPDGEQLPNTEEYVIREVNGIRLGVFNVVLDGFHNITDYPDEYIQEDPVERSQEMTAMLREEEDCDVVLLASHVPHERHFEIAERVDGLDAIFGSHSHVTFDDAEIHEDTVISEIGYAYFHVGVMTLDASGELVDWQRIDLVDDEGEPVDIEPDPNFLERLEAQLAEIDDEVSQTIGETTLELSASGAVNYARESTMGNLITNAMLDFYDEADVAFQNAGGIRTNDTYGPGELTLQDILEINPFDNEIILFEATGEQIRSALGQRGLVDVEDEGSRISYLEGEAPFGAQQGQQVAGIQYEWRGHEEPEVLDVFVDGEPIEDDETYTVATTDFIKDIASGYEAFHAIPGEEIIAESGTQYGPAVAEYISARGEVTPSLENRILRVDEPVGEAHGVDVDGETTTVTIPHPGDAAEAITEDEPYRAVTRTGAEATATGVEATDDAIEVRFDAGDLRELVSIDEPHLRVFGGFDPDDDHYDYEDEDGDQRELPVSAAYDAFKLRSPVPADALGALQVDDEDDDDDDPEDDATDEDDETDTPEDEPETGDEAPGFGPLAALSGVGGAAYWLSKRGGDEEDEAA